MSIDDALVMILAGGEGKRLYPLTKDRAKPAVPFGGRYRIIDFVLNNFINSGFFKIKVLTQYKSDSLNKHITRGWALSPFLNQYVDLAPAQMRTGSDWYRGTADAIYQNVFHITDEDPDYVCIFGGDHIYKMDVSQMLDYHKEKNADLTISAIPIPIEEAHEFGIIEVDDDWKLINFVEKPKDKPKSIPGNPNMCLASMGNYIFDKTSLLKALEEDEKIENSIEFSRRMVEECAKSEQSVALVGAKPEIVQKAKENLEHEIQGLYVTYAHDGYFRDDDEILNELKIRQPRLVLCALGSPKQEEFILKAKELLPDALFVGVGGSFDVWSGVVERAPEIYQKLGLEWLYRTVKEPKRFKRIFPTLPLFVLKVLREKFIPKGV